MGKFTLVQALRLYTGRTAHRESRGIALLFHDHGTRRGWGLSVTPRPLFTPEKDPIPILQEVGWAPGPVWTGAENLASTGIRSSDRPARSQSLYRLSYPGPQLSQNIVLKWNLKKYFSRLCAGCVQLGIAVTLMILQTRWWKWRSRWILLQRDVTNCDKYVIQYQKIFVLRMETGSFSETLVHVI